MSTRLETASPDNFGFPWQGLIGPLCGIPLAWLGRILRIWPSHKGLAEIAFYVVCRTRLSSGLWTFYTSPGEPDYNPGKANDPARRERESVTATYNALDAIKAANRPVPKPMLAACRARLRELQDFEKGYWGSTHMALEGGTQSIAGIPRHTAMAVAIICEFGDVRDYDENLLERAVEWLMKSRLRTGGWPYSEHGKQLGPLTTAAVMRALHEYCLVSDKISKPPRSKLLSSAVLTRAIAEGMDALLKSQGGNGLWDCTNDASQSANRYRDGLSIARYVQPISRQFCDLQTEVLKSVQAFIDSCERADYDNGVDPAAHPIALYLGCLGLAHSYELEASSVTSEQLHHIRVAFATDELSHWDWQRSCIGLFAGLRKEGTLIYSVNGDRIELNIRTLAWRDRFILSYFRSYVRKLVLFDSWDNNIIKVFSILVKAFSIIISAQLIMFIISLLADANDWKQYLEWGFLQRLFSDLFLAK